MRWIDKAFRIVSPRRRHAFRDAVALYAAAVDGARQSDFYEKLGVPDTIDGRFDLLAAHVVLLCRRLGKDAETALVAQALFDVMFDDMENNLRELGVSDTSVGKRVKKMAAGFYGRASAYERALTGGGDLEEALRRNLYGTVKPNADDVAAVADYLRHASAHLSAMSAGAVASAHALFPPVLRREQAGG